MVVEIQVSLKQRKVRVILTAEKLPNKYMDFPVEEEMIRGHNSDDAEYVALHLIAALKQSGKINDADEITIISVVDGVAN